MTMTGWAIILVSAAAQAGQPTAVTSPIATASTPANAADEEYGEIEVLGTRNAYRLGPKALRDAVATYESDRAQFAPKALLQFEIFGYRTNPALKGVRFRLASDDGDPIAIEPDAAGHFALPAVDYSAAKYSLLANRRTGTVRVRPFTFSPGSNEGNMRLGDARLTCHVAVALYRDQMSFGERMILGVAGDICAKKNFGLYVDTDRPIAEAHVTEGATTTPVQVMPHHMAFRVPTYMTQFSNEARLIITAK